MRSFTDNLTFILFLILVCGGIWIGYGYNVRSNRLQTTHDIMSDIHDKAVYHGALEFKGKNLSNDKTAYAKTLDPKWFNKKTMRNPFAPSNTPWLDVVKGSSEETHPNDPVLYSNAQAGFWYNPNNGIVRARVMPQMSEINTLKLYNKVNESNLSKLPEHDKKSDTTKVTVDDDED